jgi:hypothetical protein
MAFTWQNRVIQSICAVGCTIGCMNVRIMQPGFRLNIQPGWLNVRFMQPIAQPSSRIGLHLYDLCYAARVAGCRLEVGGCKNSTCVSRIAAEHRTGHQTVNMYAYIMHMNKTSLTKTSVRVGFCKRHIIVYHAYALYCIVEFYTYQQFFFLTSSLYFGDSLE